MHHAGQINKRSMESYKGTVETEEVDHVFVWKVFKVDTEFYIVLILYRITFLWALICLAVIVVFFISLVQLH